MSWSAVRVRPAADVRASVVGALLQMGAQGVHEGSASPHSDIAPELVEAFFDVPLDPDAFAARLKKTTSYDGGVEILAVADEDWSVRWRESLRQQLVGRLLISPPWLTDTPSGAVRVEIEPGMAFGTGDHASSRLALRLLQCIDVRGTRVADLGSGSGILAIAAAALGARQVTAIENDGAAMANLAENVLRNRVGDRVHTLEGDAAVLLQLVAPVDVVLANILASVLRPMLPIVSGSLSGSGCVILSGILWSERESVLLAARESDLHAEAEEQEGDWWAVLLRG